MGRAKVIGIAGTAKNTGKTTTTSAILQEGYSRRRRMAITSIGYDGEERDNVTGLLKPRLHLQEGTLVAVARGCLELSSAGVQVLEDTGIATPLGSVVIGEVRKAGLLLVAGPNKSLELKTVASRLEALGAKLILVDGALNRMAPMLETQGMILATGAARTIDIQRLSMESSALYHLFNLPLEKVPQLVGPGFHLFWQEENAWKYYPFAPKVLFSKEGAFDLAVQLRQHWLGDDNSLGVRSHIDWGFETVKTIQSKSNRTLYLSGMFAVEALETLISEARGCLTGSRLIFRDPIQLYLSGDYLKTWALLREIRTQGIKVGVLTRIPILAVTVNPFYPEFEAGTQNFLPRKLPPGLLEGRLKRALPCPVINIKRRGIKELWRKAIGFY